MTAKILATATLRPENEYTMDEVRPYMDKWLSESGDELTRRKGLKIFGATDIAKRASAFSLEQVFSRLSFQEKNDLYIEKMIDYGTEVLKRGLDAAGLTPRDIDYLITTSCTGFMIPSVDAHMVNRLEMRTDIVRLPVTEMGCAGGTSALIYAQYFIKANPGKRVAVVSVELPSINFQLDDYSIENIVSTSIFADGAACVILGETEKLAPEIVDTNMYHFKNAAHLMGYELRNSGLKIVLDRDVPKEIEEHFPNILLPFLKQNNLGVEDVQHYMFHPGGKKIIQMVDKYISQFGKDISESKDVLRLYGNMSSATILHILHKVMQKEVLAEDLGYMLAFGPGFMAQSLLLKWS
jgi:alkylresorcinol/alkylpyrone synthase